MERVKFLTVVLYSLFAITVYGQKQQYGDSPRKQDLKYYQMRDSLTYPSFGFQKIQELIRDPLDKLPKDYAPIDFNIGISALDFANLSTSEKFTYCIINPEIFSQNCAEPIYFNQPEKKIFPRLIAYYPSQDWSDRQLSFFKKNKPEVLSLFEHTLHEKQHFGINLKGFLIEANAWEEIPFLITYYRTQPADNDILTVLLVLMKNASYRPFLTSSLYNRLYLHEDYFTNWIPASKTNVKEILLLAEQYYLSKLNGYD